jgi:HPt (histidine-containing phosphotransfer) domain-containing protein
MVHSSIMHATAKHASSFDRELALSHVGGDEALLREIAQIFLSEYPPIEHEIGTSIQDANADRLQTAAHKLKGSLGTLGAEQAHAIALRLEMAGRAGSVAGANTEFTELQASLKALQKKLQELISEAR